MTPNEPNDPEQTRPIPNESDPTRPVRLPGQAGPAASGPDRSEDPTVGVPPGVAPHDLPVQKPKIYIDPAYGQGQEADAQPTRALPAQPYPTQQYAPQHYAPQQYGGDQQYRGGQQYAERDPYEQAAYEQGRYEAGPEDPVRSIWWPVAVIMASLAIVGAVGGYLWASRDNRSTPAVTNSVLPTATPTSPTPTQTSAQPSPTSTSTSSESSSTSSESSSTTSSTSTSETSTAAGTFPAGAKVCAPTVGGNARASCGFATNVAAAAAGPISQGQTQFQVTAHSPATGQDYTLNCARTDLVTCTTDSGAEVYVLVP
ncbi:hypothetical protein [Branchiibius sp. NY16-3462-2]|uniref:hypothetical protein n=1 Tax=Branchiibius sp. NY16-3462-2 TaxID=1807500 RepID=UPI000791B220|nr:hypothetical protein [Branchiibius sp. NY16-3462-2]KYH44167.1 hypothetical protein AZH51_15440 [Branchiibius sp. NY16-3462-2]